MTDTRTFPHYMLKEIFEQPESLRAAIVPRVALPDGSITFEDVRVSAEELRALRRVSIVASGTSRHAGMVGGYMIQELAGIPVDVDYASEFEYRNPLTGPDELTIVITQSGETADTIGAQREARVKGSRTLALSNVEDSTITREADGVIYTHAGKEVSIASTKAFTAQIACLFLFALHLGRVRGKLGSAQLQHYVRELMELPERVQKVLECAAQCEQLAKKYLKHEDFLFLGRAVHYPIAMDGALKLKEVSYVHAEGYPTGETKHGPNALIDEHLPVVMLVTCDRRDPGSALRYEKTVSYLRDIQKQRARVIALASAGDEIIPTLAEDTIFLPTAPELLTPILEIIPLQLFAYYMAVGRGLDVDRPRNLVKSVTTE